MGEVRQTEIRLRNNKQGLQERKNELAKKKLALKQRKEQELKDREEEIRMRREVNQHKRGYMAENTDAMQGIETEMAERNAKIEAIYSKLNDTKDVAGLHQLKFEVKSMLEEVNAKRVKQGTLSKAELDCVRIWELALSDIRAYLQA